MDRIIYEVIVYRIKGDETQVVIYCGAGSNFDFALEEFKLNKTKIQKHTLLTKDNEEYDYLIQLISKSEYGDDICVIDSFDTREK